MGTEEYVRKIEGGWLEFEAVVAHPDMMREISKLGKILGPRGLMPNPKAGTISDDPEAAKEKFGGNNLSLKTQKDAPLIHAVIAKTTQSENEISDNLKAVLEAVGPKNIKKAVVSASMGPGIKVVV